MLSRQNAEAATVPALNPNTTGKRKRRECKVPGCERTVKSQGLCQAHGAKPRICKMDGCTKQAQGNFDHMCKYHFKAAKNKELFSRAIPMNHQAEPPPPRGQSVYDRIIPESIAWNPRVGKPMPLLAHLKAGFEMGKPPAWHRNEERRARGEWPVMSPSVQLETWERELVWTEILILTGNPQTSFRHLARAWGRDKAFQSVLAQYICERQGDVARKMSETRPSSDAGSGDGSGTRNPCRATSDAPFHGEDDSLSMTTMSLGMLDHSFFLEMTRDGDLNLDLFCGQYDETA